MLFHDAEVLVRLRRLADRHDVLLIFDEIFTGFGRTGPLFVCQGSGVTPDIVTLSKALTGGTLPLSATIANARVFDAFCSVDPRAALMHGPTYMANPLACAAANASLDLFEGGSWTNDVARIERGLREGLAPCRELSGVIDVRTRGAIGVVEFERPVDALALCSRFADEGVWIRPMGRVVYLTPAFVIGDDELALLTAAIRKVLGASGVLSTMISSSRSHPSPVE
jgi:adenosylmethionine-8-amino-7-oxononanoate aminotransferase